MKKQVIFIKHANKLKAINLEDIYLIEAQHDSVRIALFDKRLFTITSTMKGIMEKLPENKFVRIHNSFIVPLHHITAIEGYSLTVNKEVFPIGREKKLSLMKHITIL